MPQLLAFNTECPNAAVQCNRIESNGIEWPMYKSLCFCSFLAAEMFRGSQSAADAIELDYRNRFCTKCWLIRLRFTELCSWVYYQQRVLYILKSEFYAKPPIKEDFKNALFIWLALICMASVWLWLWVRDRDRWSLRSGGVIRSILYELPILALSRSEHAMVLIICIRNLIQLSNVNGLAAGRVQLRSGS